MCTWCEVGRSLRPGITGHRQIEGTGSQGRDFEQWSWYDGEYIQRARRLLRGRVNHASE